MKTRWTFVLFALVFLTAACEDIFVPDIRDEQLILRAPADSLETESQIFTFAWEPVDGAEDYRLEIVRPAFDSLVAIVLDTLVQDVQFGKLLLTGEYQWRVSARNEAYTLLSPIRMLSVLPAGGEDLPMQTVTLLSPADQSLTNAQPVLFSWQPTPGATQYRLEVGQPDLTNVLFSITTTETSREESLLLDGMYSWRVRGENEQSLSFSPWTTAAFSLDRSPPAVPELIFPPEGDTLSLPAQSPDLSWNFDPDSVEDRLLLFADLAGNELLLDTLIEAGELNLDNTGIDLSGNSVEDYFWQVQSIDGAGNTSDFSSIQQFYILP